jgi:exodeoxyribonuclease VII large subunit
MAKLKSQWEFGELFAEQDLRRILTVTELTASVKRLIEQQFGRTWVTGEITNLRQQSSGHLYFALKDPNAQLSCVLFRGDARSFNRDLLRDGVGVNLQGDLTVYEARGQYQLIVTAVELQGVGALQVAFEKLKQKLLAEGLFAKERKRSLPRFPHRLGIVTSPTGAAIRDVLQTIGRRHPGLELVLASCRVQGQGAGEEVACAIRLLNDWNSGAAKDPRRRIDLILVTRGGGSLEDLWAFNEETVARAIYVSEVPVVSAVGHEIDFTISDFVADVRAATPTAAAEIITEGFHSSRQFVARAGERLRDLVLDHCAASERALKSLVQRLNRQHPLRWLQGRWLRVDDLQMSLQRCVRQSLRFHQSASQALGLRLWRVKPSQALSRRREDIAMLRRRLREQLRHRLRDLTARVGALQSRLRLLSPQNVLNRGYSITLNAEDGEVIQSAAALSPGQRLTTRLKEGQVDSIVEARRESPR